MEGEKKYQTLTETGSEAVQPLSWVLEHQPDVLNILILVMIVKWHFTVLT